MLIILSPEIKLQCVQKKSKNFISLITFKPLLFAFITAFVNMNPKFWRGLFLSLATGSESAYRPYLLQKATIWTEKKVDLIKPA